MPTPTWRDLQQMLEQKQTGQLPDDEIEKTNVTLEDGSSISYQEYKDRLLGSLGGFTPYESTVRAQRAFDEGFSQSRDNTEQAMSLGYGMGRRDYTIPFDVFAENPDEARAQRQTQASKVVNGATKAVPYAATTFLDNTVGLLTGMFAIGEDIGNGGEFHPMDSFISNPFAEKMQQVREWSDRVLPNYRTQEELDEADQWWKHLNGNFWGDVFLKNLGFTIGAMASGSVWAKGFRSLAGGTMRNAYKTAMAAAAGDKEAEAVFQSVLRGEKLNNPKGVYDAFERFVRQKKHTNVMSQIVGGVGGAVGESRVEALNAAKEFRDAQDQQALSELYTKRDALLKEIATNSDYSDGEYMTPAGQNYYNQRMAQIAGEYDAKKKSVEELADGVANTTFWLNMPILTASNIVMGGRLFSGGFDSQAKNLVKGTMGQYTPKLSVGRGIMKAAGNSLTEGMEELSQKIVSEGAKDIADARIGTFANGKYDKDATRGVSEWMMSMLDSAGNVLVDPKSWEEFAVGALTGALGGGPTKGGWSGGVIGGFQEGYGSKEDRDAVAAVNERINSPEFQSTWRNIVRHNHFENIKDKALQDDQRFIWHGANDAQMLNDVLMFADIGRLNDLEQFVDSFTDLSGISAEELSQIRELAANELGADSRNISDAKLVGWLQKRAGDLKKTINQYRSFYDTIDYMSLGTTDDDVVKELIYSQMQMQNAEDRYGEILDGVISSLKPELLRVSRETKADGQPTANAQKARKILDSENNLRTLFGGAAIDTQAREDTDMGKMAVMVDDATQDDVLATLDDIGAFTDKSSLKKDVEDLQKLVRSRQKFYSVLFNPAGRKKFVEEVQNNIQTDDDSVKELENDARKKAVDKAIGQLSAATSVQQFHSIFDTLDSEVTDDDDTYAMLQERIQQDPKLAAYDKETRDAQEFVEGLKTSVDDDLSDVDPSMLGSVTALKNFLDSFDVVDLLRDMPEGMTPEQAIAEAMVMEFAQDDPNAARLAVQLLRRSLNDKAIADRLASVVDDSGDGDGDGRGEGTGDGSGEGTGSGGGTQMIDVAKAAIRVASTVEDENLNALANGDFANFPGLTMDEMAELSALANDKLSEIRRRNGYESTDNGENPDPDTRKEDPSDDDPRRVKRHADYIKGVGNSLPGNMMSIYDDKALREGRVERNTKRGRENSVNKLIYYRAQQFVDSGALATLDAAYREKNKKDTGLLNEGVPVYFIGNPHFIPNNYQNNPFAAKEGSFETMLAVEIDDEARSILKKAKKESTIVEDRLIEIDGKKYQLIGQLWAPTESFIKGKPEAEQAMYANMRKQAQDIWQMAMGDSVLRQYNSEVEKSGMGVNAFPAEGKWYVAKYHETVDTQETDTHQSDWTKGEPIYTTVDYIMSGRNITGDRDQFGNYKKYNLKNSLKEYTDYGGKYYFAMPTATNIFYSNGSPAKTLDVSVNAPLGSLWISTQEPNGDWSWNYVSIARTGEYDFVANKDTKYIKELDTLISALFVPNRGDMTDVERKDDFENRLRVIHQLRDFIYFGDGNTVTIRFASGNPIVYVGSRECTDKQQFYDAIRDGNYRFQVTSADVEVGSGNPRIQSMLDAGILTTEMQDFVRRGASFGVNFMVNRNNEGGVVKPYHLNNGRGSVAWTPGAYQEASLSEGTDSMKNIRVGTNGFEYDPSTGEVRYMAGGYRRGARVETKALHAQVVGLYNLLSIMGPGRTLMGDYSGRRWNINDKNHMFVNMYESEVDGVKVRIVQRGTNGAIMLVSSDEEWNNLLEIASEVTPGKYVDRGDAGPSLMSDADILAAHDKALADEGVGNPAGELSPSSDRKPAAPEVPAQNPTRGRPKRKGGLRRSVFDDDVPSAGAEEKANEQDKSDTNCPPQ